MKRLRLHGRGFRASAPACRLQKSDHPRPSRFFPSHRPFGRTQRTFQRSGAPGRRASAKEVNGGYFRRWNGIILRRRGLRCAGTSAPARVVNAINKPCQRTEGAEEITAELMAGGQGTGRGDQVRRRSVGARAAPIEEYDGGIVADRKLDSREQGAGG